MFELGNRAYLDCHGFCYIMTDENTTPSTQEGLLLDINWYPGHMTKARRMMQQSLQAVDLVIEVVDARIPHASRNPDFDDLFTHKQRVVVLNKADLADEHATRRWLAHYQAQSIPAVAFVATRGRGKDELLARMQRAAQAKVERMAQRGAKKTVRAMVAGIPNVGKSALINALAGAASARTGNKPGVTRGKQLIRITPWMELMDTPGVLWPKLDDERGALNLALTGAIKDEIMDAYALALAALRLLSDKYPQNLSERYKLAQLHDDPAETLLAICARRGLLAAGAQPDEERAARLVLDELRSGRLGRITLEEPHDYAADGQDETPFEL